MKRPTKQQKLEAITSNRTGETHHFFASSLGRWQVSYDPQALIATMKKDDLPFNLWLVPGPVDRPYRIEYFAPQVEGLIWIAFYGYRKDEEERLASLGKSQ